MAIKKQVFQHRQMLRRYVHPLAPEVDVSGRSDSYTTWFTHLYFMQLLYGGTLAIAPRH